MIKSSLNIFLRLSLFSFGALCQEEQHDTEASFPGGEDALYDYLMKNMKWQQEQLTVEGKVFVSFIVQKDGNITDIKIVGGLCESCNKEAVQLVQNMPYWKPKTKNGRKVKSKNVVIIKFEL